MARRERPARREAAQAVSALEDAGLYPVAGGMVKLDSFEGLEPLGVWDARDESFWDGTDALLRACAAMTWAKERIPGRDTTYLVEFYLLDGPFAVVHRYKLSEDGSGVVVDSDGEPAIEPPAIVPLAELPPARLLGTR